MGVPTSSFPIVKCTFWRSQGGAQRAAFLPRPPGNCQTQRPTHHPSGSTQRRWFPTCLGEAIPTRRTPFPLRPAHLARRCRWGLNEPFGDSSASSRRATPPAKSKPKLLFGNPEETFARWPRERSANPLATAARAVGELPPPARCKENVGRAPPPSKELARRTFQRKQGAQSASSPAGKKAEQRAARAPPQCRKPARRLRATLNPKSGAVWADWGGEYNFPGGAARTPWGGAPSFSAIHPKP